MAPRKLLLLMLLLALAATGLQGCEHEEDAVSDAAAPGQNAEVVVVVPDHGRLDGLESYVSAQYKNLRAQIMNQQISVNTDVISLHNLTAGIIAASEEVPVEEVEHDIDKIYGDLYGNPYTRPAGSEDGSFDRLHEWNRFTIGGRILFPFSFSIPGLAGPLGINFGIQPNLSRTYTFTVKTREVLENTDNILSETWKKVARIYQSIGAIRIPFSAHEILEKYPPGSEIVEDGSRSIMTNVGLNLGVSVIQANGNLFAVLSSDFENRLKVLADPDRSLVRYSVSTHKGITAGADASLTLGVTLFQTQLFSGVLNVNLLSAHTEATAERSVVFDYTYDLTFPEAQKALESALRGDLRPTQNLAIFREDADHYQGIVINQQKAIDVLSHATSHAFGFSMDNTALGTPVGNLSLNEALGGFIYDGSASSSHNTVEARTGFLHEGERLISLDYDQEHKETIFWGLLADNDRTLHLKAQIISAEEAIAGEPMRVVRQPKLTYSFAYENKRNGHSVVRDFFNASDRLLGWNDAAMAETIRSVAAGGKCDSGSAATTQVRGTIYGNAIARALEHDETDLWIQFGRLLKVPKPELLVSESTREAYLKALKRDELTDEAHKLESIFVPRWIKMRNGRTDNFHMIMLRKILRDYDDDITGFEVFSALATAGHRLDGVFLNVGLQSKSCNFAWSRKGDLDFSLGDVVQDW